MSGDSSTSESGGLGGNRGGGGTKGGDDYAQTSLGVTVNAGGIYGSNFPGPRSSPATLAVAVGGVLVVLILGALLLRKG